jgi:hypothetical protein
MVNNYEKKYNVIQHGYLHTKGTRVLRSYINFQLILLRFAINTVSLQISRLDEFLLANGAQGILLILSESLYYCNTINVQCMDPFKKYFAPNPTISMMFSI